MGKNKNRNRRSNKKILTSTAEHPSLSSNGKACKTLQEGKALSEAENRAGYRDVIQNEWEDFFNESSKTDSFKKTNSQTLVSRPLLIAIKDKAKLQIDQTAINDTKNNSNKILHVQITSSSKKAINKSNNLITRKDESPSIGSSQGSSTMASVVSKPKSLEKNPTCPVAKKFSTLDASNGILNGSYLQKREIENKKWNYVDSQDLSNKTGLSNEQYLKSSKNSLNSKSISNEVNARKNIQEIAFNKSMKIYNSKGSSGCFDSSISNGTRPKSNNKSINPTKSTFCPNAKNVSNESLCESIKNYEEKSTNFYRTYLSWRKERQETIKKLQNIVKDVHNDQLMYNKTNVLFKNLNVNSRVIKNVNQSTALNYLTSLATLVTDTASGITSMAQAFNIDGYMAMFAKIMEHDKEITKSLYAARSLCLKQYHNVEEVVRRYHSDTFGHTVVNISNALNLEELWMDIKGVQGSDKVYGIVNSLDKFFRVNLNNESVGKVFCSIQDYTEKNPATLRACESAGKIFYDIYDACSVKSKGPLSALNYHANKMILRNEEEELDELRLVADNEYETQARLESDINDAIKGLQEEMKEIDNNCLEIILKK